MFKAALLFLFSTLLSHASDFLLIGDSMAEAVAKPLERRFSKTVHTYSFLFKRGTTVNYWINNSELYSFLEQRHPDYVLISLGTNDIVAKKTNEQIIADLRTLSATFSQKGINTTIVIIAPPIPNDNNLNEALQVAFGGYVFPSKSRLLELKADQIHPTPASNERWSDEIFYYFSPVINVPADAQ